MIPLYLQLFQGYLLLQYNFHLASFLGGETPEEDTFTLTQAPSVDDHICYQSGTEASIKVARIKMKRKVQEQPSRPIPQIYEEVRKEALNAFDKYGQIAMMQDYPSLKKVMPNLYLERRSFVPPEPKTVGDLDLTSELFILDDTNQENIIIETYPYG